MLKLTPTCSGRCFTFQAERKFPIHLATMACILISNPTVAIWCNSIAHYGSVTFNYALSCKTDLVYSSMQESNNHFLLQNHVPCRLQPCKQYYCNILLPTKNIVSLCRAHFSSLVGQTQGVIPLNNMQNEV